MRMPKILGMAFIAAAAFVLWSPSAWSQSKTLKIVVPYTPGSGPDILSRLMAEQIGKAGGPTVVVENRPGGGMTIGTEAVARAAPDGNTVLLVANAFVVNAAMKRGKTTLADFEPICYLAATPMVLVVLGSSPCKTVPSSSPTQRQSRQLAVRQRRARHPRCTSPSRCSGAPPSSTSTTCPMAAPRPRSTR